MNSTNASQEEQLSPTQIPGLSASRKASVSPLTMAKAFFVLAAGLSFLFSVYLWFLVDREQGLFVGIWVPSILALGALLLSGRTIQR